MRYPIDTRLRGMNNFKIPAMPKLLPVMNLFMRVFCCKPDKEVQVTRHEIGGYQEGKLPVYLIEPRCTDANMPCMVIFHGGGFMLKASGGHYHLAKEYAKCVPCKVIYADYRLAPKYKFPVPAEDCFAAYQWVLEHSQELGVVKEQIVLAGDSAGGNLAAAVSLMARDRGLLMPAGCMMIYPVTDRRQQTESMKKYVDTPVWDAKLNAMMWKAYLGHDAAVPIEYASPLEAPAFIRFPKAYIEVAEYDCLRDEGIAFFHRLQDEGLDAVLYESQRSCHGYERAWNSPFMKQCMTRRLHWLRNTLDKRKR